MTVTRSFGYAAATLSLLAASLAGTASAEGPLPSLDAPDLAQGQYAYMQMLLQKTILRINVATIEVRVDKAAQTRFVGIARGQAYSDGLEQQLANVAVGAGRAVVQMRFKRDIPLGRWMGVVRDNLEQARKAGLITADLEKRVGQSLPVWFAALKDRGYEKDDRLVYSVTPDALHTVVVSKGGQVLVDRKEQDEGARKVVMASYFAPGSDFREPLLRSLVGAK
jgi:hypothetical protein